MRDRGTDTTVENPVWVALEDYQGVTVMRCTFRRDDRLSSVISWAERASRHNDVAAVRIGNELFPIRPDGRVGASVGAREVVT